jgi:hypothetical protein
MRFLAAALLALAPASAAAVAIQKAPAPKPPIMKDTPWLSSPDCPQTASHYAYRPGKPVAPRKLGELPPANMYAAVLRHDGRCEVPVIVKYGVGGR